MSGGTAEASFPAATRTLLLESIEHDYETLKQKTSMPCWAVLKSRCEGREITAPSYGTFCAAVRQRDKFTQALKRMGRRAAYKNEPPYWELDGRLRVMAIGLLKSLTSTTRSLMSRSFARGRAKLWDGHG